jgi:excisionase family DNA binding protein
MTTVHMFCTLREAAQRLHVSEEQVETMVENGLLREFRAGPHRLVKAANVELLASISRPYPTTSGLDSQAAGRRPPAQMRLPRCAAATVKMPDGRAARPRNAQPARQPRTTADRRLRIGDSCPGSIHHAKSEIRNPQTPAPLPGLSLRQWLWDGLTQDRPVALVVLFGLALLVLSALVAGVYILTRMI